jgi:hypothetical protein
MGQNAPLEAYPTLISASTLHDTRRVTAMLGEHSAAAATASVTHKMPLDCYTQNTVQRVMDGIQSPVLNIDERRYNYTFAVD